MIEREGAEWWVERRKAEARTHTGRRGKVWVKMRPPRFFQITRGSVTGGRGRFLGFRVGRDKWRLGQARRRAKR